jgi:hypothetical protein
MGERSIQERKGRGYRSKQAALHNSRSMGERAGAAIEML